MRLSPLQPSLSSDAVDVLEQQKSRFLLSAIGCWCQGTDLLLRVPYHHHRPIAVLGQSFQAGGEEIYRYFHFECWKPKGVTSADSIPGFSSLARSTTARRRRRHERHCASTNATATTHGSSCHQRHEAGDQHADGPTPCSPRVSAAGRGPSEGEARVRGGKGEAAGRAIIPLCGLTIPALRSEVLPPPFCASSPASFLTACHSHSARSAAAWRDARPASTASAQRRATKAGPSRPASVRAHRPAPPSSAALPRGAMTTTTIIHPPRRRRRRRSGDRGAPGARLGGQEQVRGEDEAAAARHPPGERLLRHREQGAKEEEARESTR